MVCFHNHSLGYCCCCCVLILSTMAMMVTRTWAFSSSVGDNASNNNNNNKKEYDLVVIGGGSAGLTAAKFASTFSKSSIIIEQAKMGGDCTWYGCVPSKSFLAAAKAAHTIKTASKRFGVDSTSSNDVQVDIQQVLSRVRDNMERIYDEDDSPQAMAKLGIDTLVGEKATVVSPKEVRVGDTTVVAKQGIVIATGAKPRLPMTIEGLNHDDKTSSLLTYEDIWSLEKLPTSLAIVGGGPIGCEMAQAFARFGSKVTLIASRLLPREEPEVGQRLEQVLVSEGVEIVKGRLTKLEKAKTGNDDVATCVLPNGTARQIQVESVLLLAVGRVPNVQGLGLENVGVSLRNEENGGGIETNDRLQTTVKSIYAAGDCTGGLQYTHYAGLQGAIAARNILLPFSDGGVLTEVPKTTFTNPEISSVGLTEAAAKELHGDSAVGVAFQEMSHVDRAVCENETSGFIKVVYSTKNYHILGATVMSPSAAELISEIGVAIQAKMPFDKLVTVVHSYPAYSIALQIMAGDIYYAKTLKMKPILNFLKRLGL